MTSTSTRKLAALAAVGALVLGGTVAAVASSPAATTARGTVHIWVTPGKGAVDKIMLTGAIGDYGKATSITKSGKVDTNGKYVKVKLQQGRFEVNAVAFNKKASKHAPNFDRATCSLWTTITGPVTLFDGTGAYAGIQGSIRISTSYAQLGSRFTTGSKKGKCDTGRKSRPLDTFRSPITGSGKVKL